MTELPRETKRMGTHKEKKTNEHTKHKLRLNTQKSTLGSTGLYELVHGSCAHGKLPMNSLNASDHFNCSPLLFS